MTEVRIVVDGRDGDQHALWDWLRREPELRGHIRAETAQPQPGEMGSAPEIAVQVAATIAGAGAIWGALAKSVSVWLTQRRSDVSVRIVAPDGREVLVDAKRIADPERLVHDVLTLAGSLTTDDEGIDGAAARSGAFHGDTDRDQRVQLQQAP